jgi:adenylate cyclase, class 2
MATETEAKMKVPDLAPVREKLVSAGGKRLGSWLENNCFYDTPDIRLRRQDRGIRIRVAVDEFGKRKCTVTMKGPLQKGEFKTREEIEFTADDPDAVEKILENLGLGLTLSFEKKRESWSFAECEVELDELPYLGKFVEIEGKTEAKISNARSALGLADLPLISSGYISLLSRYLEEHGIKDRKITF